MVLEEVFGILEKKEVSEEPMLEVRLRNYKTEKILNLYDSDHLLIKEDDKDEVKEDKIKTKKHAEKILSKLEKLLRSEVIIHKSGDKLLSIEGSVIPPNPEYIRISAPGMNVFAGEKYKPTRDYHLMGFRYGDISKGNME